MYAIISPISSVPSLIAFAPNHTIAIVEKFIIIVIAGITIAIVLCTKRFVIRRSLLDFSNRFSSCFSLPNARITIRPERFSRLTRLSLSISFCSALILGIAAMRPIPIMLSRIPTATSRIQLIPLLLLSASMMLPTAIVGAKNTSLIPPLSIPCTCCMSFVVLVMSDAVENSSISLLENLSTRSNTS